MITIDKVIHALKSPPIFPPNYPTLPSTAYPYKLAAVLLLLFPNRHKKLQLLVTKRAAHLHHHAGQISFPGGRAEPTDATLIETALRENQEETGIPVYLIKTITTFPPIYIAHSKYLVTPVISYMNQEPILIQNTFEVEEIIQIPLDKLLQMPTHLQTMHLHEKEITTHLYPIPPHSIWGATAEIITYFNHRLKE